MALESQIGEFEDKKQSYKTEEEIRQWLKNHKIGWSTGQYIAGYLLGKLGISWISIDTYDDSLSEVDYQDFVFWFEGGEESISDADIQAELDIDPELRDDLAGLARYVAAEIEQDDVELRKWCVEKALCFSGDLPTTQRKASHLFNYIKTGKYE